MDLLPAIEQLNPFTLDERERLPNQRAGACVDSREGLARPGAQLLRALEDHLLSGETAQPHRLLQKLLEALPYGVCLLDAPGQLVMASSLAVREFGRGFPLACHHRRLRATECESDAALQAAIHGCLSGERERGVAVVLGRAAQAPTPLTVLALPLGRAPSQAIGCLLLLIDPEARIPARAACIEQALQLTHAEALLALALMEGVTLQQAARRLRRSYNTCKTQIKSIYGKTGCRTQSELVRKLLVLTMGHSLVTG